MSHQRDLPVLPSLDRPSSLAFRYEFSLVLTTPFFFSVATVLVWLEHSGDEGAYLETPVVCERTLIGGVSDEVFSSPGEHPPELSKIMAACLRMGLYRFPSPPVYVWHRSLSFSFLSRRLPMPLVLWQKQVLHSEAIASRMRRAVSQQEPTRCSTSSRGSTKMTRFRHSFAEGELSEFFDFLGFSSSFRARGNGVRSRTKDEIVLNSWFCSTSGT